jgi:hypothetical protein
MDVLEILVELAPRGELTGQPGNLMSFFGGNLFHVKCYDYSRDFGSEKGRALLYVYGLNGLILPRADPAMSP